MWLCPFRELRPHSDFGQTPTDLGQEHWEWPSSETRSGASHQGWVEFLEILFLRLLSWKQIFSVTQRNKNKGKETVRLLLVVTRVSPDLSWAPRPLAVSVLDFCSDAAMSVPFPQGTGSGITGFHD